MLREVGVLIRQARSGKLIVRLKGDAKAGEVLFDSDGRAVGKVTEVFGPIRSPYASLEPLTDKVARVIGEKVYLKN
ncbi:MAG: Gar1/Naf1 family protein [Conexivisphaerales archaeon]